MNGRRLEPAAAQRALTLSIGDGVAYAVMIGAAETYFVADVIALGATPYEIAAAVGVPLLAGAIGPALALRVLPGLGRRRPVVVAGAVGQALALSAAAVGNWLEILDPLLLIACLCIYHVCGQAAGAAWSSWFGDLVPAEMRGRWFARRTKVVHLATFVALCGGGAVLWALEREVGAQQGFAALFAAGAVARCASAAFLASSPEPGFHGLQGRRALRRFLGTSRGKDALVLLTGGGAYQGTVYLSGAFFTPFMLEVIGLDYLQFMIALGAQVGVKVLALNGWGRLIDRAGAKGVFRTTLVLTAVVPLPWVFLSEFWGVLGAQLMSGFVWAGYEVALFALLLESSRAANRPHLFAAQSIGNAVGQVSGSAAGAVLLTASGYVPVFAASVAARTLVALALPVMLSAERGAPGQRRPALLMRIVGLRPGPGVVHRPVLSPEDPPGDPRA